MNEGNAISRTKTPAGLPRHQPLIAALCVVTAGLAIGLLAWWTQRPSTPELVATENVLDVPLGVEEAAIIRYAGPELIARPYRRGASVNVRIAQQTEQGKFRVYDVRYVVNLPGDFNLVDYLTSSDGTPIDNLPAFIVRGQTRLTKDIETRIREIEKVEIDIPHHYYETMSGLGLFWVAWLLGLVFIGRPPKPVQEAAPEPPPSIQARIGTLLDALQQRELSVQEKALLEQLLLQHWSQQLDHTPARLSMACRTLQDHPQLGAAYKTLQTWLHRPESSVDQQQILDVCGLDDRSIA